MDIWLLFSTAIVRHFYAIHKKFYEFFSRVSQHHYGLAVLNLHQRHILKISWESAGKVQNKLNLMKCKSWLWIFALQPRKSICEWLMRIYWGPFHLNIKRIFCWKMYGHMFALSNHLENCTSVLIWHLKRFKHIFFWLGTQIERLNAYTKSTGHIKPFVLWQTKLKLVFIVSIDS